MTRKTTNPTPKKGGKRTATNWHQRFIRLLADTGNVTASASGAGVDRATAYDHRQRFPEFAAAWDAALEEAVDALEAEARRRAMSSSDTLLIFLLKGLRPGRYRETIRQELSGPSGSAISVEAAKRMAKEVLNDES